MVALMTQRSQFQIMTMTITCNYQIQPMPIKGKHERLLLLQIWCHFGMGSRCSDFDKLSSWGKLGMAMAKTAWGMNLESSHDWGRC